MLLGHASRIKAGMNGDNMMRIKWGQSCNPTQLTWHSCVPAHDPDASVDTGQVSQAQAQPSTVGEWCERSYVLEP